MAVHDLNVLLVEDDQNVLNTLRNMLKEYGVSNVFDASNGEEALALVREDPDGISFVICDWNMPKKSGIEFLEELRNERISVPFLMVTARADENSVLQAKNSGVSAYICKPFSYAQLKRKMNFIIDRWLV